MPGRIARAAELTSDAGKGTMGRTWDLWVGLVIAVVFGLLTAYVGQAFLAAISFLIAGAMLTALSQRISDAAKRAQTEKDLALAIYLELANRAARCLFDFEDPWERWMEPGRVGQYEVDVLRLRKFMAIAPTIYPAAADKVALLKTSAVLPVIRFYSRFDIYRSDMEAIARHCELRNLQHVPPQHVAMLAERLRRTLRPALQALRSLSTLVPESPEIETEEIAELDSLFKHARAHQTLRQRLEHYTEPKERT
jgi:hypothetical protein